MLREIDDGVIHLLIRHYKGLINGTIGNCGAIIIYVIVKRILDRLVAGVRGNTEMQHLSLRRFGHGLIVSVLDFHGAVLVVRCIAGRNTFDSIFLPRGVGGREGHVLVAEGVGVARHGRAVGGVGGGGGVGGQGDDGAGVAGSGRGGEGALGGLGHRDVAQPGNGELSLGPIVPELITAAVGLEQDVVGACGTGRSKGGVCRGVLRAGCIGPAPLSELEPLFAVGKIQLFFPHIVGQPRHLRGRIVGGPAVPGAGDEHFEGLVRPVHDVARHGNVLGVGIESDGEGAGAAQLDAVIFAGPCFSPAVILHNLKQTGIGLGRGGEGLGILAVAAQGQIVIGIAGVPIRSKDGFRSGDRIGLCITIAAQIGGFLLGFGRGRRGVDRLGRFLPITLRQGADGQQADRQQEAKDQGYKFLSLHDVCSSLR